MISNLLAVALGGAVGASLRYASGLAAASLFGTGFPAGTLFVNVVGSFLMGYIAFRFIDLADTWKLLLMTGLLGGFTTFSAFSLDFVKLLQGNQTMLALVYLLCSVALSIVALVLGARLAA